MRKAGERRRKSKGTVFYQMLSDVRIGPSEQWADQELTCSTAEMGVQGVQGVPRQFSTIITPTS